MVLSNGFKVIASVILARKSIPADDGFIAEQVVLRFVDDVDIHNVFV
jgi:hypothetical protein